MPMNRSRLAAIACIISLSARATDVPEDRYPIAMADMAGIIQTVGSMSGVCSKVSPQLGDALKTAASKWRTRNHADIAEVTRRVPVLLDRIYREEQKENPSVKRETVKAEFDSILATGQSQLTDQVEQSNGRSCVAYVQYLGTDRSNLGKQPGGDMNLIRSRKLDGTSDAPSKD